MSHVFVSYSRQDQEFVDRLAREIEETGFSAWVDREAIRGGSQWRAAITQAIRDCGAFLAVLSPSCTASTNVGRELELAADHNRSIIPIIYRACEIPPAIEYHFAGVQRLDFTVDGSFQTSFDQLIEVLKPIVGGESVNPAPSTKKQPDVPPPPRSQPQPTPTWSQPGFAPQPAAVPALIQLMPGYWNVQISHPMLGAATGTLNLAPNGFFEGQLMRPPMIILHVRGQWQATPMNQIMMQGQQTDGFQTAPYGVVIQITQVTQNQLIGTSSAGEQVLWNRIVS